MSVSIAEDYVPIACAFHERLEFAVLRRQRLRIRFRENGGEQELLALPTDVLTGGGAEWLDFCTEDGQSGRLRLDSLVSAEPV